MKYTSNNIKPIQSPEGVAFLLENLWLRHRAGIKERQCKVYMVELPPPTEEELAAARRKSGGLIHPEDDSVDLYGAWI